MTSCDQENEGALYNSTNNNISWEKSAVRTTTAENEIVVPVMILLATQLRQVMPMS